MKRPAVGFFSSCDRTNSSKSNSFPTGNLWQIDDINVYNKRRVKKVSTMSTPPIPVSRSHQHYQQQAAPVQPPAAPALPPRRDQPLGRSSSLPLRNRGGGAGSGGGSTGGAGAGSPGEESLPRVLELEEGEVCPLPEEDGQ